MVKNAKRGGGVGVWQPWWQNLATMLIQSVWKCYQLIPHTQKHGHRHQNHVCMSILSKVMVKNAIKGVGGERGEKLKFQKKKKNIFITHREGAVVKISGLYLFWCGLGESQNMKTLRRTWDIPLKIGITLGRRLIVLWRNNVLLIDIMQ